MRGFFKFTAMALGVLAAQGCGNSDKATFASWDSLGPNSTARIDGNVKFAAYTANTNTGKVTPDVLQERDGQLIVGFDGGANLNSTSVEAGQASVGFSTGNGDTIMTAGGLITWTSANGEVIAVFADPNAANFNYQTYGSWLTGYGTGSGVVATGSFGRASDPVKGEVPGASEGTYNYEGGAGGVAVAADGTPYRIMSDATVAVHFDTGMYEFNTFNTTGTNINTADPLLTPSNYNLTGGGTLNGATLVSESNNISATDPLVDLSGSMGGTLYGPNAEEVGGTYALTGGAGSYIGSFGAVLVP